MCEYVHGGKGSVGWENMEKPSGIGTDSKSDWGGGGGEFSACTNFFFFFSGEPLCTNFFFRQILLFFEQ